MKLSSFFPMVVDDLFLQTKELSKAFFQDYKTWVKQKTQKIVTDTAHFQILINLSLFTFAFSQMVFWRYKENSFSYLLRNNVPGVCYPFQTVSWDTFSTFFKLGSENKVYDSHHFLSTSPQKPSPKIYLYPDSILVSPDSEYFKHELFDIGILPYTHATLSQENQMQKNNLGFLHNATHSSNKETTNESQSKVSWRSFFSHRLDPNLDFFQDEFPTKLDSDLYETFPEMETRSFFSSGDTNQSLLTQTDNETFSQSIIGSNQKKNSINVLKQKNPKLPQNWGTNVRGHKNSNQQKIPGIPVNFVQKSIGLQAVSKFYPNHNFSLVCIHKPTEFVEVHGPKTTLNKITEQKESEKGYSRKMKLFLKQSFFLKQIANIAYDFDILPQNIDILFSDVESLHEENSIKQELVSNVEEDIDVNEVEEMFLEEGIEEDSDDIFEEDSDDTFEEDSDDTFEEDLYNIFEEYLDHENLNEDTNFDEKIDKEKSLQELLRAADICHRPNPSEMVHAIRQSGFLYPDTSTTAFLKHQTALKKNPFFCFSRKGILHEKVLSETKAEKTWKTFSVPKNHNTILCIHDFLNKEKFQPQNFFTEIASQVNIKRLNSKEMTNGFVGNGETCNNDVFDIRFAEHNEINIWQKKYFSSDNIGTDRKHSFFGFTSTNKNESQGKANSSFTIQPYGHMDKPLKLNVKQFAEKLEFEKTNNNLNDEDMIKIKRKTAEFAPYSELIEKPEIITNLEILQLPQDSDFDLVANLPKNLPYFLKRLPVILSAEKWKIPALEWEEFEKKNTLFSRIALPKVISTKNDTYVPFEGGLATTHDNFCREKDFGKQKFSVFQPWPLTSLDYKPFETHIFSQEKMSPCSIKQEVRTPLPVDLALRQPTLFFQKCTHIFSCFFPWSRSHVYHIPSQNRFDIAYTKVNPFFQNTVSSDQNFDLIHVQSPFEPLTKNSWLVLHKISCTLLAFQLIQRVVIPVIEDVDFFSKKKKKEKNVFQIKQSRKGFQDVAGIDDILPDLSEIVWFFRQKGRSMGLGKVIPKGILLVGPPGTGKTFVVRAVAGESGVPVLLQSGSTFHFSSSSLSEESGPQQLRQLFSQARQLAPCILFIDEIDALGQKRHNVIEKSLGQNELLDILASEKDTSLSLPSSTLRESKHEINAYKTNQSDSSFNHGTKLNLLTQFLIEMDGLQSREGVIVIGATNRPDALDPAFLRPGRFDKVLQVELPAKQKRIQIVKLYSKNIGIDPRISWDYVANRTEGCSAADLSAAMNESSIQAILHDTYHTIETIEQGLHSIQNFVRQKPLFSKKNGISGKTNKDPFVVQRLAFSQVGKAILFQLLPQHPPCSFVHLWEPWLDSNDKKSFLKQRNHLSVSFQTRFQIENRLIGLYAGKASELLLISKNSQKPVERKSAGISAIDKPMAIGSKLNGKASWLTTRVDSSKNNFYLWESDINKDDIQQATLLAYSMVNEWHFYSEKLFLKKNTFNLTNQNREDLFLKPLLTQQFIDDKEKTTTSLFQVLFNKAKTEALFPLTQKNEQTTSLRSWWQNNLFAQPGCLHEHWFRIYLDDPEQSSRNEEFVFSDSYYYNDKRPFNVLDLVFYSKKQDIPKRYKKALLSWNDFYAHSRDFLYQGLVTSSLNKAFSFLDKNREMVDFFADFLLRHEIIRENTIYSLFSKFYTVQKKG